LTLGRKERHEYPVALIGRDTRTIVGHCDDYPAVWMPTARYVGHNPGTTARKTASG
jgi:hypothetical protein